MPDSERPHRQQPTRLLCPWDSPGKNSGVGCHFLLQCMKVKSESEVAQSCWLLATPWTGAYEAPPSMGFSRQEYWSWVPLPSPEVNIWYSIIDWSTDFIQISQNFMLVSFICFCILFKIPHVFSFSFMQQVLINSLFIFYSIIKFYNFPCMAS